MHYLSGIQSLPESRTGTNTPEEFSSLQDIGFELGFSHVFAGPLVRSSYHAAEQHEAAVKDMS